MFKILNFGSASKSRGPSDREQTAGRERRAVGWVPRLPSADMFELDVQNIELWLSIQVRGPDRERTAVIWS